MSADTTLESMEQQLRSIYEEREFLDQQIGTSTADGIIDMIRSLEAQLADMYNKHGHKTNDDAPDFQGMLKQVRELSSELDSEYSKRSIVLTVEHDKPVLKAVWEESAAQGDC
ncbi:MAG: hypothetical protein AAGI17_00740 [Planctomycetota bacterium]